MKKEFLEVLDDLTKKMSNMSIEEFERDVMCLNGTMTLDLFEKVLEEVKDKDLLDAEDLAYFPERFKITSEEFLDVFHYLSEVLDKVEDEECMFPRETAVFVYHDVLFLWDLMIGQGSSCIIKVTDSTEKAQPVTIDETIRFYKRLKSL